MQSSWGLAFCLISSIVVKMQRKRDLCNIHFTALLIQTGVLQPLNRRDFAVIYILQSKIKQFSQCWQKFPIRTLYIYYIYSIYYYYLF